MQRPDNLSLPATSEIQASVSTKSCPFCLISLLNPPLLSSPLVPLCSPPCLSSLPLPHHPTQPLNSPSLITSPQHPSAPGSKPRPLSMIFKPLQISTLIFHSDHTHPESHAILCVASSSSSRKPSLVGAGTPRTHPHQPCPSGQSEDIAVSTTGT